MNRQLSFASNEYQSKRKRTWRDRFLAEMEQVVPWQELVEVIQPHYPRGTRGRPPVGVERMLRVYFLQQWYALADEALEDAIYDSQAMRAFVGVDLSSEAVPDATTLLKFRHLLVRHDLTKAIFEAINEHLSGKGRRLRQGTIVDATIIAAPPSTKNQSRRRDPEMHQTKKGNQWHFGMKAHVGVDANTGLVHTVVATPANESDLSVAAELLHGGEKHVFADAGYTGLEKRREVQARPGNRTYHVAIKRANSRRCPKVRSRIWPAAFRPSNPVFGQESNTSSACSSNASAIERSGTGESPRTALNSTLSFHWPTSSSADAALPTERADRGRRP